MSLDILKSLDYAFTEFLARVKGEDWHDDYKKDPRLFRKVIKADIETERNLMRVLSKASKEHGRFIRWDRVKIVQAAKGSIVAPLTHIAWKELEEKLAKGLIIGLGIAVEAGGEATEIGTAVSVGWSRNATPAVRWLRNHSFSLVKNLNKTTRDNLRSAIKTGLKIGEDQKTLTSRVQAVIADRKRASTIAHTETIRSYSQGRLLVADKLKKDFGFKTIKVWRDAQPNACPICQGLHNKSVDRNKTFKGGYDGPPAHPNCRCNMNIEIKE